MAGERGADVPNVPRWTPAQREFMAWLAVSRYERIPPTRELLAEKLGLNRKTLCRWAKLPGFQDEVLSMARLHLRHRLPEIYGALGREAEKGSFQHIKLALETTGEYAETKNLNTRVVIIDAGRDPGPFGAVAVAAEAGAGNEGG